MGTVNLELACAAGDPLGFHSRPCQSIMGDEEEKGRGSLSSHQGVLDGERATLVKIVFFLIVVHKIWIRLCVGVRDYTEESRFGIHGV